MNYFNQKAYRVFDKEGIKLKETTKINVTFDLDASEADAHSTKTYLPSELQRDSLNFTDLEFIDAVISYMYDTTSVAITKLEDLERFPSLNDLPFLLKINEYDNDITVFALAFGRIPGSLIIRKEDRIFSLGNIVEIDGTLGLSNTSITSFGKLKKVNGSLWISYHDPKANLSDLNEIEEIGGSLLLRGFGIKLLSNLKKVGGVLNLRGTEIEDLGKLEFVGEHLYLPKAKQLYFNLDKIYIGGKVKFFSS